MAVITVSAAALRLRRSYQTTLRLVLIGVLKGRRTADGRYEIDLESVDTFAKLEEWKELGQNPDDPRPDET